MCHFQAQNSPFVLNKFSLAQTTNITFIQLLVLLIVQNLKNILTADLELSGYAMFGLKMLHLPQAKLFFGENYKQHRTWLTSWCLLYYLCNSEEIIV